MGSPWNHAPKRLWKRLSVHLRPDIHAAAVENGENFMLIINNVLARKYGLTPCTDDAARKMRRLRRLQRNATELEQEIAALSIELQDDELDPGLRAEIEGQRAEMIALRGDLERSEAETASRMECIRSAVGAIVAGGLLERYWNALPENDPSGDRVDDWDALLAGVSRRCGMAVDPAEVIVELRRRHSMMSREEEP